MNITDKKIAFLTAAYNGEKTLQRTIDSIKAQTHQNFEYFILNDGSGDGTQKIIDENCRLDTRLHSIFFSKNDCQEHFIAAIKEILKRDDFDFFAICDHDDEYLPNFAEYTLKAAEKTGADAVFTEILYNTPGFGDGVFEFSDDDKIIRTPEEFAESYATGLAGLMRTQWGKLFSIKALRETNLDVIKILKYGRDTIFCNEITSHCDTVVILALPLYRFYSAASTETNRFEPERINSPAELYNCASRFIKNKCGKYAYITQDFIHFNYINDLDFTTRQVINSDLPESLKIDYLISLYSNSVFINAANYPNIRSVHIPANNKKLMSFEKLCETAAQAFLSLFPYVNEKQLPDFASAATLTAVLAGYDNPKFPIMGQAEKAVIITVAHNASETIKNAAKSVLSQTYWNFDYYLVDSSSTDNTSEIIRELSEIDPRIHTVFYDENNFPDIYAKILPKILENTEYKYFAICDSDDELAPQFLENALKTAYETGAQTVISEKMIVETNKNIKPLIKRFSNETVLIKKGEASDKELIRITDFLAWNSVLFSTDVMRNTDITIHNKTIHHHDTIFTLDNIINSNLIAFIPQTGYIYYVINNSVSRTFNRRNAAAPKLLNDKMSDFFKAYSKNKQLDDVLNSFLVNRKVFEEYCYISLASSHVTLNETISLIIGFFENDEFYKNKAVFFSENNYSKRFFLPVREDLLAVKNDLLSAADEPEKSALKRIYKFLEKE
jgi:glycosyltransferase involved in cell wall biosynthesis